MILLSSKTPFQPIIKWSGSKRSQSQRIVSYFPGFDKYYEPFVGGGSILYAADPIAAVCSDICKPLIDLWKLIQSEPLKLLDIYRHDWLRLQTEGFLAYYEIRERFNLSQQPADLFFCCELV